MSSTSFTIHQPRINSVGMHGQTSCPDYMRGRRVIVGNIEVPIDQQFDVTNGVRVTVFVEPVPKEENE